MEITRDVVNEALCIAVNTLKECYPEFNYQPFTKVTIKKSSSFWGRVRVDSNGRFSLTISKVFEEIPESFKPMIKLIGTSIHELIHTVPGCLNHGEKFKHIASCVNNRYPEYDVRRIHSLSSFGININNMGYKYVVECPNCGNKVYYKKRPYFVEFLEDCTCGRCGGGHLKFFPFTRNN